MKNIKEWIKDLPEKKQYIDFLTATMSVPILITVIVTNVSNLTHKNETKAADHVIQQAPSPIVSEVIKIVPVAVNSDSVNDSSKSVLSASTSATPIPQVTVAKISQDYSPTPHICKKEVGPVSIISPAESEVITNNPVCIDISFNKQDYCGVMWSYKLDNGSWSDYMDKSICLYNLSPGTKKIELRIKSIGSADEVRLIRNFIYQSEATPTLVPTNTPEPTQSTASTSALLNSTQNNSTDTIEH